MGEIRTLADLLPDDRNANKGNPRGRGMVETSLQKYGAGRSVLVDRNGKLIAGNKTSEAAAAIGLDDVVVVQTDGSKLVVVQRTDLDLDTDTTARELAISDNRSGELGLEWDADVLTELSQEIDLSTFWTKDEIAAVLEQEITPGGGGDEAPDVQDGPTRVQPGDIFALGEHRVVCVDSTDIDAVSDVLEGEKPAMVWADPPYGIAIVQDNKVGASNLAKVGTYAPVIGDDTTETARTAFAVLKDQALTQIWWGANNYADALPPSSCWLVWDKRDGMDGNNFADCELAWTSTDGAVRMLSHRWSGMLRASERDETRVHPTQKPVALAEWAFERYGKDGDLILDPFLGSGMSIIAAERMQRRVVGFELSPTYCDVAIARWERETGQQAVLLRRIRE